MDRLLLLLCYQDSPDTGPGLVEQSRRNDAPVGRGEERDQGRGVEGKGEEPSKEGDKQGEKRAE